MDKQREAFERHIEDCIASEVGLDRALVKDGFGDYCVPWVSSKWSAWQTAQAAQPAQVPGWLPIESAPKDGTEVLLGSVDGSITCATYSQLDLRWYGDTDSQCKWATHWMPLPAAPSPKEGQP